MAQLTHLKRLRHRSALTQQELANLAGVHRVTVARLESGVDEPGLATVRKLARALAVAPEELAGQLPAGRPEDVKEWARIASACVIAEDAMEGVVRRLVADPNLASVVAEAAETLPRYFPCAQVRLEHLIDPEWGDEQLFLSVLVSGDPKFARAALRRFDCEWWFPEGGSVAGDLLIDTRWA